MSREPGTRIVDEIEHGYFTIAGRRVHITESVWNGGAGSSFEVYQVNDDGIEDTLTMDEAFDEMPTRQQVADLILAERDQYGNIDWSKPPRDDPAPPSVAERDEGQFMIYDGPYMTGPYASRQAALDALDDLKNTAVYDDDK